MCEIRDAGVLGKGVFALRAISQGEIIHMLAGPSMSTAQLVRRVLTGGEAMDDPLQVGRRTYIDLDEISRCFNHSCRPNGGLRKRSELFALRDIAAGEQITYDYSTTIAPTVWEMRCTCGVPECRRQIGDIGTIPRDQLDYYKQRGAIQRYLRPLLDEIKNGSYQIPEYEIRALLALGYSHEAIQARVRTLASPMKGRKR